MTPDEHMAEAEYHARLAFGDEWDPPDQGGDGGPESRKWRQRQAQIHATLALAGYIRDSATGADHVHDIGRGLASVTGITIDKATGPGRPT